VYEESRRGGAIIATAHEHTYSRTHLLADVENQVVASTEGPLVLAADDPTTPEDEGRSFAFVSGLGGHSIRDQEIDGPWWASVYTSDQGASAGALFAVFNYEGDPNLARFYFKDVGGRIVDDFFVTSTLVPAPPTLRIEDVAVAEGDSGSSEVVLRVTLLGASGQDVAVDYATLDGDAAAGEDYEAASGRLSFPEGATEQSVRVPIWGDASIEGEESFFVELSAAHGAVVARARAEVVVLDDDAPPAPLRLEVDARGPGLVTLDPPGGLYPAGTPVTLTAVAAPGHAFAGWEGDLAGAVNPATLLVDRDRQVGARFAALEPSLVEVASGGAGSRSSVSTTAPLTAAEDHLYLAAIASKPSVAVTGVSGLGLVWTPVRTQCAGRGQTGVAVWQARGEPTAAGVVTATFSATPQSSVIAVSRYGGVGSVDPLRGGSANSVGIAGACTGGSDSAAYALDVDTTTANSVVYVAAAARHRDHLPGLGFVERAELFAGSAGSIAGVSVADFQAGAPASIPVEGAFSGSIDWAVVALEIPVATPFTLDVEPGSGGSVEVDPPFGAYAPGAAVTLTAFAEEGHRFTGWTGDLAGSENPETLVMNEEKAVGATFLRLMRVTSFAGSGGSVALDPPGGAYESGTSLTLTASPDPGHRFTGWHGDLSGLENPAILVVDADKSVSAGFVSQFTVSVQAGSAGSVTLDPPGGLYDDGSSVTVTAVPDAGHRFGGWSGVLSGAGNPATLVVEAHETIGASFVAQSRVSVTPAVGGTVALDPPGGLYDRGTHVTLTAVPAAGHRFGGWSGALAGAGNPATLVVDADQIVGASFVRQWTVMRLAGSGGSISIVPPGGIYDAGTTVTLTAAPNGRHRFAGWFGALTGPQNPATLLVDANKVVAASFVQQFGVSVTAGSGGSVTLDPPGGLYDRGVTVTVTATPAAGNLFAGWDGDLAASPNPTSVVVDRDLQVGARFLVPAALQEIESGGSTDARTVSTAAPLSSASGQLYLAAIAFKPDVAVTSVSGLGLSWSPVLAQCSGRGQTGLAVWQARGQPGVEGVVTATFSAAPQNAVLAVTRYADAGPLDAADSVSANSVGVAGACAGGEDQVAYALPLDTTTPGGLVYVAAAMRHRDHLPGSGTVERVELYRGAAGSIAGVSVADLRIAAPGPTAVSGRFDALVDWAAIALEIPASPAAP
jgi:hypothetical protein